MLRHPAVLENLAVLRSRGVGIVEPGSGYLACGWLGDGRLAETADIVEAAMAALGRRRDMEGETVLVTAGPTVEDIDPVRFVSNRSTGRMGTGWPRRPATPAARRVVWSPGLSCPSPRASITSASARRRRCRPRWPAAGPRPPRAMAAAVSDYRPATVAPAKMKKTDGPRGWSWVRTPDILRSLGDSKGERFLVGFAAETEALLENARRKRTEKQMDLIVANDVSANGSGFASDYNAATLIDELGEVEVPLASKRELADKIWDRVAEVRRSRSTAAATKARGRGGKPA